MREHITSKPANWIVGLLIIGLAVFIGVGLVLQPVIPWLVLAGLATVLFLQFPPYLTASAAVVFAVFSRLFVAWGIIPSFLIFFHFPLALIAAFVSSLSSARFTARVANRLLTGILTLGLLNFLSWIAYGGEILRPILSWLLFVEPFLVLYAIIKTTPSAKASLLSKLAIGLAVVQIPFAFWQATTLGLGDVVQGTLVGHGAGAHIAGAIALIGVVAIVEVILAGKLHRTQKFVLFILVVLLFAVPILADAKQSIAAFIPSMLILLWIRGKIGLRSLMMGSFVGLLVLTVIFLYQPLRMMFNLDLIRAGLGGKVLSYQTILNKMLENPTTLLLGLGPGNSVSRAALSAQEGYIKSLPAGLVSFHLSPVTAEILSSTEGFWLFASSSVWSGISSWLGLFGDLGLLGVAIYIWILWIIWKTLGRIYHSWAYIGKVVLVMGVLLGAVFSWLETPEFTLPWSLYMAISLVLKNQKNSHHLQLLPTTQR